MDLADVSMDEAGPCGFFAISTEIKRALGKNGQKLPISDSSFAKSFYAIRGFRRRWPALAQG